MNKLSIRLHGMSMSDEEFSRTSQMLNEQYLNQQLDYRQINNSEYYITSCGYVFRILKNKRLKFRKPSLREGYFSVVLKLEGINKWYRVHRLVCKCYHDNDSDKPFVNHLDGNKLNNHYLNLEWCTPQENTRHAFKVGLQKSVGSLRGRFGNSHPKSVSVHQYDLNGIFIKEWESMSLASKVGFVHGSISRCCQGNRNLMEDIFGNTSEYNQNFSYEEIEQMYYILNNWDDMINKGLLMSQTQYISWYMNELSKYESNKEELCFNN